MGRTSAGRRSPTRRDCEKLLKEKQKAPIAMKYNVESNPDYAEDMVEISKRLDHKFCIICNHTLQDELVQTLQPHLLALDVRLELPTAGCSTGAFVCFRTCAIR